ncbi:DUF3168 domain-containing protein [Roseovarius salis]|uniref:DUF3168 domain-containing protein n=1 Tax=Roseovarius salis TaxID=3376063 RepID=UPI0037C89733
MSYAMSAALQEAVHQKLSSDAALVALLGGAIYDAPPAGTLPETYVAIGPEDVRDRSDGSGRGAWHRITVTVVSAEAGFRTAKAAASAISDALADAPLVLSRGRLVAISFQRARARREDRGRLRRIDLTFRARVEETG